MRLFNLQLLGWFTRCGYCNELGHTRDRCPYLR